MERNHKRPSRYCSKLQKDPPHQGFYESGDPQYYKGVIFIDNTVTKALGVLQENGVYACFLYLLAKEKENGSVIIDEMLNLLAGLGFGWDKPADASPENVLSHISSKVTIDLERLLLAKETLEQMLIYARYGAKARG